MADPLRIAVLSSGGERAAFMMGFVFRLTAAGDTKWTELYGISAGALLGSYIAQVEPSKTEELRKNIEKMMAMHTEVMKPWVTISGIINAAVAYFWHDSLFKDTTLHDLVSEVWKDKKYRDVQVGAHNMSTGKYEVFPKKDSPLTIQQVIASASIPVVFAPVKIDNDMYCDGAIDHILPVDEIIKRIENVEGDVVIDIMLCYPTDYDTFYKSMTPTCKYNLMGRVHDTLNASVWHNMNCDLDDLADYFGIDREAIRKSGKYVSGNRTVRMFIPEESIYLDFQCKNHAILTKMQQHGIEIAGRVIESEPISISSNS